MSPSNLIFGFLISIPFISPSNSIFDFFGLKSFDETAMLNAF